MPFKIKKLYIKFDSSILSGIKFIRFVELNLLPDW